MIFLNQSAKFLKQGPGLEGIKKQIELAGRTCYKSLDKITPESAEGFVQRMINSNHTAMLEHGAVYLKVFGMDNIDLQKYVHNPYSRVVEGQLDIFYITTNYRVIIENGWENDLNKYLCDPTEYHVKRNTVHCTTSLHCYKDLTRHRTMSFAIESTRYCNYSKDKFSNSLTFIIPSWISREDLSKEEKDRGVEIFSRHAETAERDYLDLIAQGWQPQQAAEVLPQCIKADMVITGFESDWNHLFDLRLRESTGKVHPDVLTLAKLMFKEINDNN